MHSNALLTPPWRFLHIPPWLFWGSHSLYVLAALKSCLSSLMPSFFPSSTGGTMVLTESTTADCMGLRAVRAARISLLCMSLLYTTSSEVMQRAYMREGMQW